MTVKNQETKSSDEALSGFASVESESQEQFEDESTSEVNSEVNAEAENNNEDDLSDQDYEQVIKDIEDKPISKADFDKVTRKLFGKIGELNSKLQRVKSREFSVEIDPSKLNSHREMFDEEFTNNYTNELKSAIQVKSSADDESDELDETTQAELLNEFKTKHPDYQQVLTSKEYAVWKHSLPPDVQNELESGWDLEYINEAITTFKTKVLSGKAESDKRKESKLERLRRSLQIQGTSEVNDTAGLTESDGFASVARRS